LKLSKLDIADFDCFERADSGSGRSFFEVYAWQARNKTCIQFIYGGLLGNRNRFETSEECYKSCHDAILRALYFYLIIFYHKLFLKSSR
jgi:hypothetical protein